MFTVTYFQLVRINGEVHRVNFVLLRHSFIQLNLNKEHIYLHNAHYVTIHTHIILSDYYVPGNIDSKYTSVNKTIRIPAVMGEIKTHIQVHV